MRLRRLELAILAITLAFAFFMGGFFTGRSMNSLSVTAVAVEPGSGQAPAAATTDNEQLRQPSDTGDAQPQAAGNQGSATQTQAPAAQTPEPPGPAQGTGSPKGGDGKININTATSGELTDLPGIGNVIASRIIDYRTRNGSFSRIEDIMNVSGIGERRYEAIKDLITTGG